MFISSIRLRRVDVPDEPTPGVVPPADKAPAPATTPPAAAAPADPAAPKKPLAKGLLVGLIAGGAALVVVAIIAVVVLVLPSIFGGGSTDTVEVVDIGAEPETTWEYNWVGDNDEDYLESEPSVAAVGDDHALVWATFDYYSYTETQGDSAGWYEGYDEQYADGYSAGREYKQASDAWWEALDFAVPIPEEETYFPQDAYGDYDEWLGFQDGFYDGAYDQGEGYSQKQKPVDPDYTPTLALLNAADGGEAWSIDLTDAIDGVDFESSIQGSDIEGSDAVLVYATTPSDGEHTNTAVTISKSNGEVISTLEADGPISASPFGGDLLIAVTDSDGDETTIGRYGIDAIDDDAKWEISMDGAARTVVIGDFVMVYSDEDEFLALDANSGEEAEWGDDLDSDVYYSFLGSQLLRFEDGEIEGYNTAGDSVWEDAVESEMSPFYDDGALLVAEEDGDQYTELQRINPGNGSQMWAEAFGDEFDYVIGVQGNSLLLAEGDNIIVVDLGSGEERFSQKAGDFYGVAEGANQYYVSTADELAAYSYGEKGDAWTMDLDDNESITLAGKHLVLVDSDGGTLHGLAP